MNKFPGLNTILSEYNASNGINLLKKNMKHKFKT